MLQFTLRPDLFVAILIGCTADQLTTSWHSHISLRQFGDPATLEIVALTQRFLRRFGPKTGTLLYLPVEVTLLYFPLSLLNSVFGFGAPVIHVILIAILGVFLLVSVNNILVCLHHR